jgi:hypothetical protein
MCVFLFLSLSMNNRNGGSFGAKTTRMSRKPRNAGGG